MNFDILWLIKKSKTISTRKQTKQTDMEKLAKCFENIRIQSLSVKYQMKMQKYKFLHFKFCAVSKTFIYFHCTFLATPKFVFQHEIVIFLSRLFCHDVSGMYLKLPEKNNKTSNFFLFSQLKYTMRRVSIFSLEQQIFISEIFLKSCM